MSKIDPLLKKSFQGKLATRDDLSANQEAFTSASNLDYAIDMPRREDPFAVSRFVPYAPQNYALRSLLETTTVPRRFRRYTEQALIFGADVISEGTQGDIITASQMDSENDVGISANFAATPYFATASETFVSLHRNDNDNTVANSNLKVYPINTLNTNQISISNVTGLMSAGDGDARYVWTHYGYKPVKMLPLPDTTNTTTTYLAILPEDWPVYDRVGLYEDPVFGKALTKVNVVDVNWTGTFNQERLLLDIPNGGVVAGDFILLRDQVHVIESTTDVGGGRDVVFSVPLPGFDITALRPFTSLTIQVLFKVGELTANPGQSPGSDANFNRIPALYNSPCLDWIRVRHLYPPTPLESHRSLAAAFIAGTPVNQVGLGPVLIPVDGSGDPLLATEGTSDFARIVLNPAISEDQEVIIDHVEGAFHLSHPIVEASELNPNSYFDAHGYPVLYALFAAWNGIVGVRESVSLSSDAVAGDSIRAIPKAYENKSPVSLASTTGWMVDLGTSSLSEYHKMPEEDINDAPKVAYGGNGEAIYFSRGGNAHAGPLQVFEQRSKTNSYIQVGGFGFGGSKASVGREASQFVLVPDMGDDQSLTNLSKPDIRFTTYKSLVGVGTLIRPITTGDVLSGKLNGVPFTVNLIAGADETTPDLAPTTGTQSGDGQRTLPEIIEDIVSQIPGGIDRDQDYKIYYYLDGSDYILVFEARQSLVIDTDDAGLFSTTVGAPQDLEIGFGYSGNLQDTLRYVRRTNELSWSGKDFKIKGVSLGHNPGKTYLDQGFDLGVTTGDTTVTSVSILPGKGVYQGSPFQVVDESLFIFNTDTTYALYYNGSTGQIQSLVVPDSLDNAFNAMSNDYDIPLYVCRVDSTLGNGLTFAVDVRDFLQGGEVTDALTVGTLGRLSTLQGAIELAKTYALRRGESPCIEILEDLTLNMEASNFQSYGTGYATPYLGAPIALPFDMTLKGNGHIVTVTGLPNQTGLGDPIFRANRDSSTGSHVHFEHVTFKLAAGEAVDGSVWGTNVANPKGVSFHQVYTEKNGTNVMNLITDSNINEEVQALLNVSHCKVEGGVRFAPTSDVKLQNLQWEGVLLGRTGVNGLLVAEGLKASLSAGDSATFRQKTGSHVHVSNFAASLLTVDSDSSGNSDLQATLQGVKVGSGVDLGGPTNVYSGHIDLTQLHIDTASSSIACTVNEVLTSTLTHLSVKTGGVYCLHIIDSDVTVDGFRFESTNAGVGLSKNGVRIQGDNGTTVNGTPEMTCNTTLRNGHIVLDNGYGVFVSKRSVDDSRTLIQNVSFEAPSLGLNSRGIVLNKVPTTTDGNQARNVKVYNCTFNAYRKETSGGAINENVAIAASLLGTGSTFEGVYASGNTIIGDNSNATTATGFYEVNLEGGRTTTDINFFLDN